MPEKREFIPLYLYPLHLYPKGIDGDDEAVGPGGLGGGLPHLQRIPVVQVTTTEYASSRLYLMNKECN